MTLGLLFSLVSAAGLMASVVVVLLLRRQLRTILIDLCGGEHRAAFWVALSGIWIVLVGLLSATATLGYWTNSGDVDLFSGATTQARLLLVGLLGAVLTIAAALLYTISRTRGQGNGPSRPDSARSTGGFAATGPPAQPPPLTPGA